MLLLCGINDLTLEGSCRLDGVNFHHENDFVVNFYDEKMLLLISMMLMLLLISNMLRMMLLLGNTAR